MTGNKPSAARRIVDRVQRYLKDNRGVSTVEYALIVVGVVTIVGAGVATLSGAFNTMFDDLKTQIEDTQDVLET